MCNFLIRKGTKKQVVKSCNVEVIIARGRTTDLIEIDPLKKTIVAKHTSSYNIGYYRKKISGSELVDCHKSFIVNKNFITGINADNTLDLAIRVGECISVSRRKRPRLIEAIEA